MADTLPRAQPPRPLPKRKKRKRPQDDEPKPQPQQPQQPQKQAGDKPDRKRQKKKKRPAEDDDGDLDYDLGLNRAIARMDSRLLADYVARQTQRFGADLSSVELADLQLGAAPIADTSAYEKDRTLENLPDFLASFCDGGRPQLSAAPSANGAPHTIIVTGAGLRAADLVRALRPFQTATSTVSKLFAKHIKIAEAAAFLKSHRTGIAVGTPARLIDLLDSGALSVAHLRRLVVDTSHIDQKKRGVLDMKDTALPVVRWLVRPEFRTRYDQEAASPLSILFY